MGGGGGSKVLFVALSRKDRSSYVSSSTCSCSGRPFLLYRFGVFLCGVWLDLGGGVLVICDCGLLLVGGVGLCVFRVGSMGGLGVHCLSGGSVGVSQFSPSSGW